MVKYLRHSSPEVFVFDARATAEEYYACACESIGRLVLCVQLAQVQRERKGAA